LTNKDYNIISLSHSSKNEAMPIRLRIHPLFRTLQRGDRSPSRGLTCAPLPGVDLSLASLRVRERNWVAVVTGFTIH